MGQHFYKMAFVASLSSLGACATFSGAGAAADLQLESGAKVEMVRGETFAAPAPLSCQAGVSRPDIVCSLSFVDRLYAETMGLDDAGTNVASAPTHDGTLQCDALQDAPNACDSGEFVANDEW